MVISAGNKQKSISRRRFLQGLTTFTAGGLLAACALPPEQPVSSTWEDPSITSVRLPRQQPPNGEQDAQHEEVLRRFLAFSAILTGVEPLDAELGRIYLQSLQASAESEVTIDTLLEQLYSDPTEIATTLAELEGRGIFQAESTRKLAEKVMENWYTGIYTTPEGEQAVATFTDALAWQTLVFTKPTSVCGSYRFWTEPPETAID